MSKTGVQISLPILNLDKNSGASLTKQLYEQLRRSILEKRLRPGERLPATRLFATELGVSRNTVLEVFEQLKLEGYLESRTGSGTFVSKKLPDQYFASALSKQPEIAKEILKTAVPLKHGLEIADPLLNRNSVKEPFLPFQHGVPALKDFPYALWNKLAGKVLRYLEFEHLGYGDAAGEINLREAIAGYLQTNRAVRCTSDQIVITSGSQQALHLVAQVLLKSDDQFWMEDPGYHGARVALSLTGARPCFIPVTKDGMDLNYAKRYYPSAKLAYITPSHQYPLGSVMPLEKRLALLTYASEKDIYLVEDDYDSEIRFSGKPLPSLQGLDKNNSVIYIGTFSKVLFPAIRIAYIVLPDQKMAKIFINYKAMMDRQNPLLDQLILTGFIREGHFLRHLRKMRELYQKRMVHLIAILNKYKIGIHYDQHITCGMNLIVWLPDHVPDRALSEKMLQHGLITPALSDYCFKVKLRPGLILGYAAFSEKEITKAATLFCDLIGKSV